MHYLADVQALIVAELYALPGYEQHTADVAWATDGVVRDGHGQPVWPLLAVLSCALQRALIPVLAGN